DDFLEQHRIDLVRRDRGIDAPRQLFLEPVEAGRTVEICRAQFAQIGLGCIEYPRHHRLDARLELVVRQLQRDLDLEILRALGAARGQIYQHVGHVDENRRLDHWCGRCCFGTAVVAEEEVTTAAKRGQSHHATGRNDNELAR